MNKTKKITDVKIGKEVISPLDTLVMRLDTISQDMENDAKEFDRKPFNGKTVATYFGYQGAAIAALAKIIKETLVNK